MHDVELGIDGFPLDPSAPDAFHQRELNCWLERNNPHSGPPALDLSDFPRLPGWVAALVRRLDWITRQQHLIVDAAQWQMMLASKIHLSLNRLVYFPQPLPDSLVSELAEAYISSRALRDCGTSDFFHLVGKAPASPELHNRLHRLFAILPPGHGTAACDTSKLAWSLFCSGHPAADCWSASIARDLHALKPSAQKNWIRLLKLAPVGAPGEVNDKSDAKRQKAIEQLGPQEYESRADEWISRLTAAPVALEFPCEVLLRLLIVTHQLDPQLQPNLASERCRQFWRRLPQARPTPAPVAVPAPSELIEALRTGTTSSFEKVAHYTEQNGYRSDVVEAARQFHDTLHGTIADQTLRRHVGWWLWLEDVTPIDACECWSSGIRQDLRSMPAALRKQWLKLIVNMTFNIGARVPAKWAKVSQAALDALGADEFHSRLQSWLSVMSSSTPLNASTPGTDLLRCLIWDCGLTAPNAATDEALASIGCAEWKNKASRDRMLKVVKPLSDLLIPRSPEVAWTALDGLVRNKVIPPGSDEYATYSQLGARLSKTSRASEAKPLSTSRAPQGPADLLAKVWKRMPGGDRVQVSNDYILVRGDLDEYRISFDGTIKRRNGLPVRIDRDAVPQPFNSIWQGAVDAADINNGPFSLNMPLLLFQVSILTQDSQWKHAIR